MKRVTHKQFLENLYNKNEAYRNEDFEVLGEYEGSRNKILLKTKFGLIKRAPNHLLEDTKFTIESAVDKTAYWKNMAVETHGYEFDYTKSIYTKARNNIIIGCEIHGFVNIIANNHLNGRGCPKCGKEDSATSARVNNGGWSTKRWIEFAETSKDFDSFKFYMVRCWDNNEEFYKIGKTFMTLEKRFRTSVKNNSSMPYNWESILEYSGEANKISVVEKALKKENITNRYIPKIPFCGKSECFTKVEGLNI